MHLVLEVPFTSIQRSSLYKSLQSVPDLSHPKALAKDIARIQPLFAQVGLNTALQLMDYDLVLAHNR